MKAQSGYATIIFAILLVVLLLFIATQYGNPIVHDAVGFLMGFNHPTGIVINGH